MSQTWAQAKEHSPKFSLKAIGKCSPSIFPGAWSKSDPNSPRIKESPIWSPVSVTLKTRPYRIIQLIWEFSARHSTTPTPRKKQSQQPEEFCVRVDAL